MPINPSNLEKRKRIETFSYLNDILFYNPNSGLLVWKKLFPGKIAGTLVKPRGYQKEFRKLAIERLDFKAHRICWILHYGQLPESGLVIDHVNGNPIDNRIHNLRTCTPQQNSMNSRTPKTSTTGYKGVARLAGYNLYRAHITKNRKQIHLGCFESFEDAKKAYDIAAIELFGQFASINDLP